MTNKYFSILSLIIIFISCKKDEKDASHNFLYNKLEESIVKEKNMLISQYYFNYSKIENDSLEIKRYDSLYKVSLDIDKKLNQLNFSNRRKVIKFRDSIILIHNTPPGLVDTPDNLKLSDSVFRKKIEIEVLNIRNTFHALRIYRYTGLKDAD